MCCSNRCRDERNQQTTATKATNWLAADTMQEVNCPRRSAQMCRRAATRTKWKEEEKRKLRPKHRECLIQSTPFLHQLFENFEQKFCCTPWLACRTQVVAAPEFAATPPEWMYIFGAFATFFDFFFILLSCLFFALFCSFHKQSQMHTRPTAIVRTEHVKGARKKIAQEKNCRYTKCARVTEEEKLLSVHFCRSLPLSLPFPDHPLNTHK